MKFGNEEEIGKTMSPAKHALSDVEGTQRREVQRIRKIFLTLRLGGINFPGAVLFNISKVSI